MVVLGTIPFRCLNGQSRGGGAKEKLVQNFFEYDLITVLSEVE